MIRVTTTSNVRHALTPDERRAFELIPLRPDARLHLMQDGRTRLFAGTLTVSEVDPATGYHRVLTADGVTLADVLRKLTAKVDARVQA
jgi:hypothetical protein